jgi:aminoglycoside 6-adenylyltransferase
LTGSVARGDGAFDQLSDLDVELYVNEPAVLLGQSTWYEQFGDVLVVEALDNPGWHPTRLVYYADGKIDFMIAPAQVLAVGVAYDRQFRVLLDKDHIPNAFRQRAPREDDRPTPNQFLDCVHRFYAAALMWAKYLVRNDPWATRVRDWDSKNQLLQMAEWNEKARKGWDLDTWTQGQRPREWADPALVSQLDACWSGVSRDDSARALLNSISIFGRLSSQVAIALGIPPFDNNAVRTEIDRLLAMAAQR